MPDDVPRDRRSRRAHGHSWMRTGVLKAGPWLPQVAFAYWWWPRWPPRGLLVVLTRQRRPFSRGSANTWPAGRFVSTLTRSRIDSGNTGTARAKARTSALVNLAAAAAAI